MMTKRWMLAVGAVVALAVTSPPVLASEDGTEMPSASEVADAHTRFACDLYAVLHERPGNVVFSPHSIATALWMTHEGAAGDTAAEMGRVLRRDGAVEATAHADLVRALQPREVRTHDADGEVVTRPAFGLSLANAIWGGDDVEFLAPFTDTLRTSYGAPLQQVDFRNPAAVRRRVNSWVSERTNGKVPEILPQGLPSADARLLLANAVHFTARWQEAFRERATKDGTFRLSDTELASVPFMRRVDRMRYGETADARIVELPFQAGDTAFTVIVPKEGHDLGGLEAGLSAERLAKWSSAIGVRRVDLRLPRFSSHDAMDLLPVLRALGMDLALSPTRADFTGMTTDVPLHISLVLHQADIDLDEAGVEAAAATVVGMKVGAAMPREDPLQLSVDRPFLFLIRHTATGEILFMGRIADPRGS